MSETSNNEAGYKTEVGLIEEAAISMCDQLDPFIKNREYGLIVGEDMSGRMPTLIVKHFSNLVMDSEGAERIPTVFISNRRTKHFYNADKILKHEFETIVLPPLANKINNRALIVTEYIDTSDTINRLIEYFVANNIPFDISALRVNPSNNGIHLPEGSRLIEGERKSGNPPIWGKPKLTGFSKDYTDVINPLTPSVVKYDFEGAGIKRVSMAKEAREDAKRIAEKAFTLTTQKVAIAA